MPTAPKPWKGWMPAKLVLGLLSTPTPIAEVASLGLQVIEKAANTQGPQAAWEQALAQLPLDRRPVLFSTQVDIATYLAILTATQAQGLTLEEGMSACLQYGLESLS